MSWIDDASPFLEGLPYRCGVVLYALWARANPREYAPIVWPSRETIGRNMGGACERTVRRALSELEAAGAIVPLDDGRFMLNRWDHEDVATDGQGEDIPDASDYLVQPIEGIPDTSDYLVRQNHAAHRVSDYLVRHSGLPSPTLPSIEHTREQTAAAHSLAQADDASANTDAIADGPLARHGINSSFFQAEDRRNTGEAASRPTTASTTTDASTTTTASTTTDVRAPSGAWPDVVQHVNDLASRYDLAFIRDLATPPPGLIDLIRQSGAAGIKDLLTHYARVCHEDPKQAQWWSAGMFRPNAWAIVEPMAVARRKKAQGRSRLLEDVIL